LIPEEGVEIWRSPAAISVVKELGSEASGRRLSRPTVVRLPALLEPDISEPDGSETVTGIVPWRAMMLDIVDPGEPRTQLSRLIKDGTLDIHRLDVSYEAEYD